MRQTRKVRLRNEVQKSLISFLNNESFSPERRERVADQIKTVQFSIRVLRAYHADQSQIPEYCLDHVAEYLALSALLKVGDDEAPAVEILFRIKKCVRCKKWFYARRMGDRFCSDNCRKRDWASTKAGKEYRRKKAKEYRDQAQKPSHVPRRVVRKKKRRI